MREHELRADTLDRFIYRAPPLIARLVGRRPFAGMPASYARLCFPYLGAVALLRGTVGLNHFDDAALCDPAVHALAERIVVEGDGNSDPSAFVPAVALAIRRDGSVLRTDVTKQFGSPSWPLSREEHFAKAHACLEFGCLPRANAPLSAIYDAFEQVPDVATAFAPAFG
jgi:2-methylcitrate dehydratase PrpD